ncbi:MAG: (2Fe-2S)-binding protein [Bryobacteraceae bacterium]|jgi:xanthine dehydrogenase YagT iron-sulfur-binding subunit
MDNEQERREALSRRRFFNSVAGGATEAVLLGATATVEVRAGTQEALGAEAIKVVLNVNGQAYALLVEPRWTLLHALRDRLGFTGTKPGCERGECGACTVLIDGAARYACMTLAVEAADHRITTLEGLMHGEELGPVQLAFLEEDAYQCGFCTGGQVMNIEGLLRKTPDPTIEQIREGVSGNLCRCGAYANIFRAAHRAAELKKAGR